MSQQTTGFDYFAAGLKSAQFNQKETNEHRTFNLFRSYQSENPQSTAFFPTSHRGVGAGPYGPEAASLAAA
jgi:hypothetical protein